MEQEIVYEFVMCTPEKFYVEDLYGRQSRKFLLPRRILVLVIVLEFLVLMALDHGDTSFLWGIVPFLVLLYFLSMIFLIPHRRRKYYAKVHAAGEDCHTYTFYTDSMKVQTPSVELMLPYADAEYYAEDEERLMVVFPFGRSVMFDKSALDEEQIAFLRNIVPEERQRRKEKKTFRSFLVRILVGSVYALLLGALIVLMLRIDRRYYESPYQSTTYESFEGCVEDGTIKDVVIIKDKYVEYTYTGRKTDERYSTIAADGTESLKEKLDKAGVNWTEQ